MPDGKFLIADKWILLSDMEKVLTPFKEKREMVAELGTIMKKKSKTN